jgi:F0F1-type ATP synthase membrane subunit b/b'
MPQFDFSLYLPQILWFFALFGAWFLFVKYVFVPRILSVKNARNSTIGGNLQKAKDIALKAQELEKQLNTVHKKIGADCQAILSKAYGEASDYRHATELKLRHETSLIRQHQEERVKVLVQEANDLTDSDLKHFAEQILAKILKKEVKI